jgi:predicted dehydrogenase
VTSTDAPLLERSPEQVRRVPVEAHARYHARKYRHPLRKVGLFALRDGPLETVRKARSKLMERRIEAAQVILVCAWRDGAERRIGITRDLGGTPRFHPELVFAAPDTLSIDQVRLTDEAIAALEAYLPVPECPLAHRVARAVRAANPGLTAQDAGSAAPAPAVAPAPAPAPGGSALRARSGGRASGGSAARAVFLLGYGGYVREQVLARFRAEVAGAVDHKAELLGEAHRGDFPLHRDLADLLPAIAAADRPLVIVATYHSDHVASAVAVLDANPDARVFIEKPAAVTVADAEALRERRAAGAWIDIGFNRRYAAMTAELAVAAQRLPRPLVFSALVKELKLPASHWYGWPNQGTRVTGNLCHWIDLAHHLVGAPCAEVQAVGSPASDETVSATLRFEDGSIAALVATDAGDDLGGVTEHLELRGGGTTLTVDDYRRLIALEDGRRRVRRRRREKGHARMYRELRRRWLDGAEPAYPAPDIVAVARTTGRIVEAITSAAPGSTQAAGPAVGAAGAASS